LLVGEIVNDMAKQVGICATEHGLKKVSFYDRATVIDQLYLLSGAVGLAAQGFVIKGCTSFHN
jgi:hypothetical protein